MKRPVPPFQVATLVLTTVRPFHTTVSSLLVMVMVRCCQQSNAAPTVFPAPPKGPVWSVLTLVHVKPLMAQALVATALYKLLHASFRLAVPTFDCTRV